MNDLPLVSIIIPTHNRSAVLLRNLEAFTRQTYPPERMEVVIVADGCQDDTAARVRAFQPGFRLVLVEQPGQGPSAARNAGAVQAAGDYLIFVDDDIEVSCHFVAAHVRAGSRSDKQVVIGYLPPTLTAQKGFYRTILLGWWEEKFTPMRRPGYRFHYSDLLTGNFSMHTALFRQLNGFCVDLHTHEDYEFGYRLLECGAEFCFEGEAEGIHHEQTQLERTCQRVSNEGKADIIMTGLHPDLFPKLQIKTIYGWGSFSQRFFFRLAFTHPRTGDQLAALLRQWINVLEFLRLRRPWRKQLTDILVYWYLRGAATVFGSIQAWAAFIAEWQGRGKHTWRVMDLDLSGGIEAAEQLLDEQRPDGLRIFWGEMLIGEVSPVPGAETLKGRHLRGILVNDFFFYHLLALAPGVLSIDTPENRTLRLMYRGYLRQCNQET